MVSPCWTEPTKLPPPSPSHSRGQQTQCGQGEPPSDWGGEQRAGDHGCLLLVLPLGPLEWSRFLPLPLAWFSEPVWVCPSLWVGFGL